MVICIFVQYFVRVYTLLNVSYPGVERETNPFPSAQNLFGSLYLPLSKVNLILKVLRTYLPSYVHIYWTSPVPAMVYTLFHSKFSGRSRLLTTTNPRHAPPSGGGLQNLRKGPLAPAGVLLPPRPKKNATKFRALHEQDESEAKIFRNLCVRGGREFVRNLTLPDTWDSVKSQKKRREREKETKKRCRDKSEGGE